MVKYVEFVFDGKIISILDFKFNGNLNSTYVCQDYGFQSIIYNNFGAVTKVGKSIILIKDDSQKQRQDLKENL